MTYSNRQKWFLGIFENFYQQISAAQVINTAYTYELSSHSTRMVPMTEIISDVEIEEAPILDAFP